MLVFGRKVGERVVCDNGIIVTVVAITGKRVKLGFQAPPGVTIHREEIQRRIESAAAEPINRQPVKP